MYSTYQWWFGGMATQFEPDDEMKWIAYESLMVWVNTNAPVATLDVNGSLRLWNNCVPATWCNESTAWTIMYYETTYEWVIVICKKWTDLAYHRYKLGTDIYETAWTTPSTPLGYIQSCGIPTPNYPHPHPGIPLVGGTAPLQQPETQN